MKKVCIKYNCENVFETDDSRIKLCPEHRQTKKNKTRAKFQRTLTKRVREFSNNFQTINFTSLRGTKTRMNIIPTKKIVKFTNIKIPVEEAIEMLEEFEKQIKIDKELLLRMKN